MVAVKAGFYHVCAVKADGTVTCWGGNDTGQLGSGVTGGSAPPTDVIRSDGARLVVMIDEAPANEWLLVVVVVARIVGLLAVVGGSSWIRHRRR